jgi:hypothetical protein
VSRNQCIVKRLGRTTPKGGAVKTLIVAILAAGIVVQTGGQTVYSVPADSKSNVITLTVANESKTTDASNVQVRLQRSPSGVKFASASNLVKVIRATKESDVTFAFDVERSLRLNKKDTIDFAIADRVGLLGMKSVIVSFTGPTVYRLDQNFPNPFNPSTTIYYQLPVDSKVSLVIFDVLGREVRKLVDEPKEAGYQSVRFEANENASGAYFCRMVAEPISGGKGYVSVKKLLLLK